MIICIVSSIDKISYGLIRYLGLNYLKKKKKKKRLKFIPRILMCRINSIIFQNSIFFGQMVLNNFIISFFGGWGDMSV